MQPLLLDYWYQNPWTSTDALLTLNFHASPQERALISRESENAPQIWYFPEDYDIRIDDALEQIPATSK